MGKKLKFIGSNGSMFSGCALCDLWLTLVVVVGKRACLKFRHDVFLVLGVLGVLGVGGDFRDWHWGAF